MHHRPLSKLTLVCALLLLGAPAEARRPPQPPIRYQLHLSNGPTTPYDPSLLLIRVLQGGKATGQVHLPFGIGPQARAPQAWEKTQVLSFTGTFNSQTSKLELTVTADMGRRAVKIRFQGYRITRGVDGFGGIYFVDGKEQGGFLALRAPR